MANVGPAGRGHNYTGPAKDVPGTANNVPGDGRCGGPRPAVAAWAVRRGSALVLVDDAAEDIVAADRPKMRRP